jgi:hypothetical protein
MSSCRRPFMAFFRRAANRHLERSNQVIGRLDGAAGMDVHPLVGLARRKGRHDEPGEEIAVGDVLKGLGAIGSSGSGTGRAMPRLPEGGDFPLARPEAILRALSPLGPGAPSCESGAFGPLAELEKPNQGATGNFAPFAPRRGDGIRNG